MLRNGRFLAAVTAGLLTVACGGHATSDGQAAVGPDTTWPSATPATSIDPYEPRFGRQRPLVAVISAADGAELTDFVVPYGILSLSGEADLVTLATEPGPVQMMPALTFEVDGTLTDFDEEHPEGADYVIVPAMHNSENDEVLDWIRDQHSKGATIVGVCDGVLLLANSGVLAGRHATSHWFSMGGLEKDHPETTWVRDRRYVADGNVVTTTGVSASVPVSLAILEAIAGRERAVAVAESLGVEDWSAAHESDVYSVSAGALFTVVRNYLTFWGRETLAVEVAPGVDEISLALAADAWARTGRSTVVSLAETDGAILTRGGLRLVPDRVNGESDAPNRTLQAGPPDEAGTALERALAGIADSYGTRTAALVALQLEYPWSGAR